MICGRHDIEYSGSCPQCEQERHHAVMERGLNKQIQDQYSREEKTANDELSNKFRKSVELFGQKIEEDKIAAKNFYLQIIPIIHKFCGDDFLVRNYLRLALVADTHIGDKVVTSFVKDDLLKNTSKSNKEIIELQTTLYEVGRKFRSESFQSIVDLQNIERKKYNYYSFFVYALSILCSIFFVELKFEGLHIFFRAWLLIAAFFIGILLGALINKNIKQKFYSDEFDEYWSERRRINYEDQKLIMPWYFKELDVAVDFCDSRNSGVPFLIEKIKKWDNKTECVVNYINIDLDNLKKYQFASNDKTLNEFKSSQQVERMKKNIDKEIDVSLNLNKVTSQFCMECGAIQSEPISKFCGNCGVKND